ncbi:MAG TPA: ABC transporter substrate-binding protein [Herpetosiphonaceae bacterium]
MPRSSPISRRLLCFIGLLLLAACGAPAAQPTTQPSAGASAPPSASPAGQSPAAGGTASAKETLIFAADLSDQISLDPAVVYEFGGIQVVGNIYETLVSFDPGDSILKPVLAKEWEIQDSGDMWTITFSLDQSAKFASGRPVTADDVIYSWSRVLDLNKSPAFLFIDIAQLKKENMRAVDPQTVEVKLPKTASPQVFLSILSFTIGGIVDKQEIMANAGSDMGSTWLNDHSAGSGPYVLERWERGTQNVLSANPNYWRQAPAIKRVIMRNVGEAANLQAAIETGDADIVQDLGPEQIKALENNPDVQIVKATATTLVYLGMNAKTPPLDKVEIREAIRYAINYDEIVNNLLSGNGEVVQEIIPAGLFGHTASKPFKQDIAKAKELIAKAGVAEGTEIEMLVTAAANAPGGVEWSTLAAKLQSDLQQIGLKITIKAIQQSELLTIYRAQKGQLVLILWGPDFPDPDGNVTPFTNYEAKSIAWRNAWEAPDIAKLSQQAALEQDSTRRAELYKQITERVLHEGPYAVLYQPTRPFGVRKNVKGFVYDAVDTPAVSFWLLSKE